MRKGSVTEALIRAGGGYRANSIAAPMSAAITALGGVTGALTSGDLSALSAPGSQLGNLRGLAGKAGGDVPEQQVGINGS